MCRVNAYHIYVMTGIIFSNENVITIPKQFSLQIANIIDGMNTLIIHIKSKLNILSLFYFCIFLYLLSKSNTFSVKDPYEVNAFRVYPFE